MENRDTLQSFFYPLTRGDLWKLRWCSRGKKKNNTQKWERPAAKKKTTAIAKSVPGLLHMWHSSCLTQSLCMDFAGWGAESLPSVPPRSLNAGVISPEPTRACTMNLQGCYPSLKAVCVWACAGMCVCVCVRFCLWNFLFRQIAAFLKKPQVKCFKWTLSSEAGGGAMLYMITSYHCGK